MAILEQEPEPFKFDIGDKVIGFRKSLGFHRPLCGKIIRRTQATFSGDYNLYSVDGFGNRDFSGHLKENKIIAFDSDIWHKLETLWYEYTKYTEMAASRYINMVSILKECIDNER